MLIIKKTKRNRKTVYFISAVLATILAAPLMSFSMQTDLVAFFLSITAPPQVSATAERVPVDFYMAKYDLADYSRETEFDLANRGAVETEDLLFGCVPTDSVEAGITPPDDMTFYDDNTTVYLHSGGVNIRRYPSLDAEVLRQGSLSEAFTRTGVNSQWSRIVLADGQTAYIKAEFLGEAKPTPTPTPTPKKKQYVSYQTTSPAVASTLAEAIVLEAKKYLGIRYRYACEDPSTGFDCSGLTWYVFNRYGISTPRGTDSYYHAGTLVDYSQIAVGDVIAWDTRRYDGRTTITHVGLYIGGGMMIHASSSHNAVMIASVAEYQAGGCKIISVHRFIR